MHSSATVFLCILRRDFSGHIVTRSAARTADTVDLTMDWREVFRTSHHRPAAIRFIGSKSSSPSPFPHMHSPLCRHNPLARVFMIRPPIRSAATLPLSYLFCFWTAHRDSSCAPVSVPFPSLRHSSFFYNLHDCTFLPLQSFQLLSSAYPTLSLQGVRSARNPPLRL